MNNKVKQVLVLLFVVSTLLIMIGSVSANTDNLNENLEASITLNDDLSAVPEVDSGADEDVSNQLTISNIDEQTNGSSSLGATLIRLFSNHANAMAMETNRHKRAKYIIFEADIGSYYTTKTRGAFALRHTE